ncbi:hypothetical protein H1R20_g15592, partial [Candolleomyces eurysporus]
MVEKMKYRHTFEAKEDRIQDLYDGLIYQSLRNTFVSIGDIQQPYKYFSSETDIALGIATDGFAPFRKRKQTCWPILVYNLNLPPDLRFLMDYLICAGVVPGPKKPKDFDSFLYPFVSECLELAAGVKAYHCLQQCAFLLRAYPVFASGDMPAMAMIMLMKGHNAICPCRMCKIIAILRRGTTTYYVPLQAPAGHPGRAVPTYNPKSLPLRNHDDFLEDAQHVQLAPSQAESNRRAKDSGVKGFPILAHVNSLIFPHLFPFDFMHLLYENLIKNLLDFFCGQFKELEHGDEGYCVEQALWEAIGDATEESGATIPGAYGARPR